MTINFDFKTAVIILLAVCLLLVSAYFYRDLRAEQMAVKLQQTGQLLAQLNFPPQVSQALRQIGWQVREQMAQPLPQEGAK